jgi:hypothetical protein
MIHDTRNDGSGGRAEFEFSGIPGAASFLLKDDGDATQDDYVGPTGGDAHVLWRWDNCCTDGAVLGHLTGDFTIDVVAEFPASGGLSAGKIDEWLFLSGLATEPDVISLWLRGGEGSLSPLQVSGTN